MSQLDTQRLANIGESRTETLLHTKFWVLHRSVDHDGADFLIQEIPTDFYRLTDRPVSLVRVQAKYRSLGVPIRIPAFYVKNGDHIRTDFFLFVHYGENEENAIRWFFDAQEIVALSSHSADGKYFNLIIRETDSYPNQKREGSAILDRLTAAIQQTTFVHSRQQAVYLLNPPAADIQGQTNADLPVTEYRTHVLSRIRWLDISLIKKLAQFTTFIDDDPLFLPFSSTQLHGDGYSVQLQFPFALASETIQQIQGVDARFSSTQSVFLKPGEVPPIRVTDTNGREHFFPLCEGYGRTCYCYNHEECSAQLINGTLSQVWRDAKMKETRRRSRFDPWWQGGALGYFFTITELESLVECGVVKSLDEVKIQTHWLKGKALKIGSYEAAFSPGISNEFRPGMGAECDCITAIELSRGGGELISALCDIEPNPQYAKVVLGLVETVNRSADALKMR